MKYFILVVAVVCIFIGVTSYSQTPNAISGVGTNPIIGKSSSSTSAVTMVPNKISYQGILTTASGAPAPDGSYNLKFELFNVLSGGSGLWNETQTGVTVKQGTFSVLIGSVTPLTALFYQPLWVEVTAVSGPGIGAPIVFSPRTELASVPYALGPWLLTAGGNINFQTGNVGIHTNTPHGALHVYNNIEPSIAVDGTPSSQSVLHFATEDTVKWSFYIPGGGPNFALWHFGPPYQNYLYFDGTNGNVGVGKSSPTKTLDVNGPVQVKDTLYVGTPTQNGFINIYQNGATSPVVKAYNWYGQGGAIDYYDENGVWIGGFEADGNGTGGWFGIARDVYLNAFIVDGNHNNTKQPWVGITGSARSAIFDMSQTADASVQLPDSSISAAEILDEPGISQGIVKSTTIYVTGATSMIDIDTTTITIPAAGYIVVEASAQAGFSGTTAGNTMYCQIDETSGGTYDISYQYNVGFGSASPSGSTWIPVAMRRTYYKSAGTYTFRFEAMDAIGAGSKWFWNAAITATYYPTSYGPVSTAVSAEQVSSFQNAIPITNNGAELQGVQSTGQTYHVDLRELELKAANARAAAEKAERELLEAKMGQQNGSLSPMQK